MAFIALLSQSAKAQTFDFNSVTTGGSTTGSSKCVDVINADNIYSVGEFAGNVDFNADPATAQNISVSINSMFIQSTNIGNPQTYQPLVWVKAITPTTGSSIHPTAICMGAVDVNTGIADLYIVGNFSGTVDFNPDPSTTFNLTSSGNSDAFVLKMLSNGTFVYAKKIGGTGADNITSVTHNGSVNVVGTFTGTVDLNPNLAIQNATANGSNNDIFIVKLDNTGNFTWGKVITGPQMEHPFSSFSETGEIVVVGFYQGTVDFNPSATTTSLTSNSSTSFLAKYDDLGNLVWVTGQSNAPWTSGVDVSAITDVYKFDRNYYVCGYNWETIAFSTSPDTELGFSPNNNNADFIAKFNSVGVIQWIKPIDNPSGTPQSSSNPFSIAVSGGIYITGGHFGQTDFDPGAGVAQLPLGQDGNYLAKYDINGNFGFVRLIEKTGWNDQPRLCAQYLHPLWTRVVMCGGGFSGTQDFNFNPSVTNNRTSVGTSDFYVNLLDIIP